MKVSYLVRDKFCTPLGKKSVHTGKNREGEDGRIIFEFEWKNVGKIKNRRFLIKVNSSPSTKEYRGEDEPRT